MSLKNEFIKEVQGEIAKHKDVDWGAFTEDDLAPLPEPVQRCLRAVGVIGKSKMRNARLHWEDVRMRMDPSKDWNDITMHQFNSVPEPMRAVHISNAKLGILPFERLDDFDDGHGRVRGETMQFFKVLDRHGTEVDRTGLVTLLAEAFLAPSYALQPYFQWVAADDRSVRAGLAVERLAVTGTFYFNEQDEMIRFETRDRFYTEADGTFSRYKWTAEFGDYRELSGLRLPTSFSAAWDRPEGQYRYLEGRLSGVDYGVGEWA